MGAFTLIVLLAATFLTDVSDSKCVKTKTTWRFPEENDPQWKAGNIYMISGVEFKDATNSAKIELYIIGVDGKRASKPCAVFEKGTLKPGPGGWISAMCVEKTKGRAGFIKTSKQGLRACGPEGKVWLTGTLWCPPGQVAQNGVCEKVSCPSGQTLKGNKCEPIKCPSGQVLKANTCKPITCAAGKVLKGNKCEASCPANSKISGNKCKCNSGFEMVGKACLAACPANSRRSGTTCACNSGFEKIGNACQAKCPAYSRRSGTSCACNSGYEKVGAACLKRCPQYSSRRGNQCLCNHGYKMQNGVCKRGCLYHGKGHGGLDHRDGFGTDAAGCQRACEAMGSRCPGSTWDRSRRCWLHTRIERGRIEGACGYCTLWLRDCNILG